MNNSTTPAEVGTHIEYLSRALKAPRIRQAAHRLSEQAREEGGTHEEYPAAVLSREVSARESSGAELWERVSRERRVGTHARF